MPSIYQELQAVAKEVLAEFDQKEPGDASPDPAHGNGIYYIAVVPGAGPAQNPGPSVEMPYKIDGVARGVAFKYINDKNVTASDQQITMAVDPRFTPDEKGFVLIDGKRHKVIECHRKPAAGTPIAYTLVIKK
jgi:hypothetical protein